MARTVLNIMVPFLTVFQILMEWFKCFFVVHHDKIWQKIALRRRYISMLSWSDIYFSPLLHHRTAVTINRRVTTHSYLTEDGSCNCLQLICMHSSYSHEGVDGVETCWYEIIIVKWAWENMNWEKVTVLIQWPFSCLRITFQLPYYHFKCLLFSNSKQLMLRITQLVLKTDWYVAAMFSGVGVLRVDTANIPEMTTTIYLQYLLASSIQ